MQSITNFTPTGIHSTPAVTAEVAQPYTITPLKGSIVVIEQLPIARQYPRSNPFIVTDTGITLTLEQVVVLSADYAEECNSDAATALQYVLAGDDLDARDGQDEYFSTVEPNGTWNHKNRMERETYDEWDARTEKWEARAEYAD